MQRILQLPTHIVRCQFKGIGEGGFPEKANKQQTIASFRNLQNAYQSMASTRIITGVNYQPFIATAFESSVASSALITSSPKHNLLIRPADCIPIVLYGENNRTPVLALIHGGRRDLDKDIIRKTLNLILQQYGLQPKELSAYFGPAIKKQSYILPRNVLDSLSHPNWSRCVVAKGKNSVGVDINGFAKSELMHMGLIQSNIHISTIDTATNPAYYSHYASKHLDKKIAGYNGFVAAIN